MGQALDPAQPDPEHKNRKRDLWASDTRAHGRDGEFDAITKLVPLARFVFVVTVLERYSIAECALLLKLTKNEVAEARSRAISDLAAQLSHSEILASDSTSPARGF